MGQIFVLTLWGNSVKTTFIDSWGLCEIQEQNPSLDGFTFQAVSWLERLSFKKRHPLFYIIAYQEDTCNLGLFFLNLLGFI